MKGGSGIADADCDAGRFWSASFILRDSSINASDWFAGFTGSRITGFGMTGSSGIADADGDAGRFWPDEIQYCFPHQLLGHYLQLQK